MMFLLLFGAALLVSSIGFKKYIWFISLGYGFSVCAICLTLTAAYFGRLFSFENSGILLTLILITVYGARLGGYLLYRERKSSAYNAKMKKEIKSGKEMKFFVKCCIWVSQGNSIYFKGSKSIFKKKSGLRAAINIIRFLLNLPY